MSSNNDNNNNSIYSKSQNEDINNEQEKVDLENQDDDDIITNNNPDETKFVCNTAKGSKWDVLHDLKITKLEARKNLEEIRKKEKEEEELKECTFKPKLCNNNFKGFKQVIVYKKPDKKYTYFQEAGKDKNSLCETLFSGRIRHTNVILPNYGENKFVANNDRNYNNYINNLKDFRDKKERYKENLENRPGTGKHFDNKISRVTVPVRTLLFSENAFSLREVKNCIKSVKKPIAPHKFSIGFEETKRQRKNPFRISKNINLISDEADKNIMNLNAQNHKDLIKLGDGLDYEEAINNLHNELNRLKI